MRSSTQHRNEPYGFGLPKRRCWPNWPKIRKVPGRTRVAYPGPNQTTPCKFFNPVLDQTDSDPGPDRSDTGHTLGQTKQTLSTLGHTKITQTMDPTEQTQDRPWRAVRAVIKLSKVLINKLLIIVLSFLRANFCFRFPIEKEFKTYVSLFPKTDTSCHINAKFSYQTSRFCG